MASDQHLVTLPMRGLAGSVGEGGSDEGVSKAACGEEISATPSSASFRATTSIVQSCRARERMSAFPGRPRAIQRRIEMIVNAEMMTDQATKDQKMDSRKGR